MLDKRGKAVFISKSYVDSMQTMKIMTFYEVFLSKATAHQSRQSNGTLKTNA